MPKVEWKGDALAKLAEDAYIEVARMTAETVKGAAVDLCPIETSQTGIRHGHRAGSRGRNPSILRKPPGP